MKITTCLTLKPHLSIIRKLARYKVIGYNSNKIYTCNVYYIGD